MIHTVYADFNNADSKGRLRLNTSGTHDDLEKLGIKLTKGLKLYLDDDDLRTLGLVLFSEEENIWVAQIDWDSKCKK